MVPVAIIFLSVGIVQSFSSQDVHKELQDLRRIIEMQNDKIHNLEKNNEEQTNEVKNLRKIVKIQRKELEDIKSEMKILNKNGKTSSTDLETFVGDSAEKMQDDSSSKSNNQSMKSVIRRVRLNPPSSDMGSVAFYAYMSHQMSGIGSHHQLAFDVIRTNEGSGYHPSGVFIAPKSGLYVFTWSFRVISEAYHTILLAVNGVDMCAVHGQVHGGNQGQTSATIVIHVNKGDDVILRTGVAFNRGSISSDPYGYTYFAGWSIN